MDEPMDGQLIGESDEVSNEELMDYGAGTPDETEVNYVIAHGTRRQRKIYKACILVDGEIIVSTESGEGPSEAVENLVNLIVSKFVDEIEESRG